MNTFRRHTEYGAFAQNMLTGSMDLLFTTEISELLCKNRALEKIREKNAAGMNYDESTLVIRYKNVVVCRSGWGCENPEYQFSCNLLKMRMDLDMTRKDLSDLVGISTKTIKQYEEGERTPGPENLKKIAQALNGSPWDLLMTPETGMKEDGHE